MSGQPAPWAGLFVGGALLLVSLHPWDRAPTGQDRGTVPTVVAAAAPASTSAPGAAGGRPFGLQLSALDAHARVLPVTVEPGTGALGVPDDPRTLGWWVGGARPGDAQGTVVLDGHVDSARLGKGALFRLASVRLGSTATVTTSRGPVHYRITAVRHYPKSTLPAADLFVRSGSPRLVLITCGGAFDRTTRHYEDNVVAFGVPVPSPAPG